jgi:hypothetical protein
MTININVIIHDVVKKKGEAQPKELDKVWIQAMVYLS